MDGLYKKSFQEPIYRNGQIEGLEEPRTEESEQLLEYLEKFKKGFKTRVEQAIGGTCKGEYSNDEKDNKAINKECADKIEIVVS